MQSSHVCLMLLYCDIVNLVSIMMQVTKQRFELEIVIVSTVQSCVEIKNDRHFMCLIFSSPVHEVLKVSYCGHSISVIRRELSLVHHQQLLG